MESLEYMLGIGPNPEDKLNYIAHHCKIETWSSRILAHAAWYNLEHPNWAPWLAANPDTIMARAEVFPRGQVVLADKHGNAFALLSMNRINWDGDAHNLPTWDTVAGTPADYRSTHVSDGNTAVILSLSVKPTFAGFLVPGIMMHGAVEVAKSLGVAHLMAGIRLSRGALHAQRVGLGLDMELYQDLVFSELQEQAEETLGALAWWKGIEVLVQQPASKSVIVPIADLQTYRTAHYPELWREFVPGMWECGEPGCWQEDATGGTATYTEGIIWAVWAPLHDA